MWSASPRYCAHSMTRLYPKFRSNPDYSGIISERHLRRLRELIEDARGRGATVIEIEPLDSTLAAAGRQLPPTLLLNVNDGMRVMSEEIFGPDPADCSLRHSGRGAGVYKPA